MDFLIEEDENRDMMEEDVPAEIESELESPLELILRQELSKLNPNQRAAVTHGVENGLQILAGPGSGKTKVLTTRVYYLIQNFGISPENLMVVTFTNKSAKEMIKRLNVLLGSVVTDKIVMGTFHSVCVGYLRRHHKLIGLSSNFLISDRDDCLILIKRAITLIIPEQDSSTREYFKPNFILDKISKFKSLIISPKQCLQNAEALEQEEKKFYAITVAKIYEEYQLELRKENAVDFDDLLVYGLELFTNHPRVVSNIQSVLIDEFQDTNTTQYEIVKQVSKSSGSITIVGDPDQSIYAWRSAQVENLNRMVSDFAPVHQVFLEENYRSTSSIIAASLLIIKQDEDRIQKTQKSGPSTVPGSAVVLSAHPNAVEEGYWIVAQIQLLIAHHGGLLNFDDIVILVRFGALTRVLEMALLASSIPYRLLGSHKFFARAEVKDMISFLQFIDNPAYSPSFIRVAKDHLKGVGTTSQSKILLMASNENCTVLQACLKLAAGSGTVKLGAAQRKSVKTFADSITTLRSAAGAGSTVPELIELICELFHYQDHLKKMNGEGKEWSDKWLNILELKSYATTVMEDNLNKPGGLVVEEEGSSINYLRDFLATAQLATDSETNESSSNVAKVSISTVHSSKGLEFPVVFIPAVESTVYPFFRSTTKSEIAEERRLLFVAITRAMCYCSVSYAHERMVGGQKNKTQISPFLSNLQEKYPTVFVKVLQKISARSRLQVASMLGRKIIEEGITLRKIEAHGVILDTQAAVLKAKADKLESERAKMDDIDEYGLNSSPQAPTPFRPSTVSNYVTSRPTTLFQKMNEKSNTSSMNSGPTPIPTPSSAGFASALHVHRTVPPLPVLTSPQKEKVKPSLASSQPRLSFSASIATSATSKAVISKAPPTTAPPSSFGVAETRVSRVGVSVLINPIAGPSKLPSLESMVRNSNAEMEALKNLGKKDEVEVSSRRTKLNQPFKRPTSALFEWDGKKKSK